MATHRYTITVDDGGETTTKQVSATADAELNLDPTAAAEATTEVAAAFAYADIVGFFIVSDQDATLLTNSSGAPDDTIELTANTPIVWYAGCGYDCPFTADVTSLFVTVAGTTAAAVKIRLLYDATP